MVGKARNNTCEKYSNNSVVWRIQDIINPPCGITCGGRAGGMQRLEWQKPSTSRLTGLGRGFSALMCHLCDYIDLTSSGTLDVREQGIYTCSLNNRSSLLHIGLYINEPGN